MNKIYNKYFLFKQNKCSHCRTDLTHSGCFQNAKRRMPIIFISCFKANKLFMAIFKMSSNSPRTKMKNRNHFCFTTKKFKMDDHFKILYE